MMCFQSIYKKIPVFLLIAALAGCLRNAEPRVRHSVLAGQWYPATVAELAFTVDSFLSNVKDVPEIKDIRILILPHAGYPYSGQVAAYGYELAKSLAPGIIVFFAPPHRAYVRGIALSSSDYFETPLGKVKIDKETASRLAKIEGFSVNDDAHRLEHSIEIHLPFVQRIYGDKVEKEMPVLPLLVGDLGGEESRYAAAIVKAVRTRNPLIIVSSDFTHYGPRFEYLPFAEKNAAKLQKALETLDKGAVEPILKFNKDAFMRYYEKTGITVCGRNPIALALALPIAMTEGKLLKYETSCAITGECDHSVSYAAIAIGGTFSDAPHDFPAMKALSPSDKTFLLQLARKSIRSVLYEGKKIAIERAKVPPSCCIKQGVFVTLKKTGELRGCIGTVLPDDELYNLVIQNAYNAAFRDPRFPALSREEFERITIEISVLTMPVAVQSVDEIEVGRDGLIIVMDGKSGLLLPQVPVEQGWTKEEFLVWLCRKAHLPDDAWRRGAQLYRFQAVVFSEN